MPGPLPDALARLVAEMERRGFVVTTDEPSESIASRLVELAHRRRRAGARVRLVRDRGSWSAEVEIAGVFYDAYSVSRALDDAPYSTRALSHEERRRFTLDALDRLPQDETSLVPIRQRLLAFNKEYNRRLGVEVD